MSQFSPESRLPSPANSSLLSAEETEAYKLNQAEIIERMKALSRLRATEGRVTPPAKTTNENGGNKVIRIAKMGAAGHAKFFESSNPDN